MRNHVEFIIQANIFGCSVLIEQCSSENTRISALWRLTHSHKHNFVGRKKIRQRLILRYIRDR